MTKTPTAKPTPPKADDAQAVAPTTPVDFELLKAQGYEEVTTPLDGSGFVVTGASGFKRPKR